MRSNSSNIGGLVTQATRRPLSVVMMVTSLLYIKCRSLVRLSACVFFVEQLVDRVGALNGYNYGAIGRNLTFSAVVTCKDREKEENE